jgi:NADH-quinone oxidoreductase subunit M
MITLFLIAWPLITGLLLFLSGEESARKLALVSSLVQLVATAFLFFTFQSTAETQFLVDWPWVQSLGIHFKVGIDGISIIMVLLTNLLLPFIILSSGLNRYDKSNALYALMLIMQSALIGVFTSLDGFLYYIFLGTRTYTGLLYFITVGQQPQGYR